MEVYVINLTTSKNRVKIKYNLNPKIHTCSCVYISVDNEARKKITRLKYSNEKQ
jgi:hypothetical protein